MIDDLAVLKNYKARSITSLTGPDAFGNRLSKTNPNQDRLENIVPGETVTLAEMDGPGEITHMWFTVYSKEPNWPRKLMFKMFWDGEDSPSVEAPIGDFFGLGHGMLYHYVSAPFVIASQYGLNCYWPMPFAKSARIEISNEGEQPIGMFYYIIDYRVYDAPREDVGLFHAKYRQEMPTTLGENYKVLEAEGCGHFVGLNMNIELDQEKWWGAGDAMIWIDGEELFSVSGTAGEDYFGGAWAYKDGEFHAPFIGNPLQHPKAPLTGDLYQDPNGPRAKGARWNVYRYHIPDPVPFKQSIRMEFEVIEDVGDDELVFRQDHYSSVAYWYQREPHTEFFTIPPAEERLPMTARATKS